MDAKLLFVCGDASGAGKSSISMGIIGSLLASGYKPNELAYIKPCTQCEDVQLISKYCEQFGIEHNGVGPVKFYSGFTTEVIEGKDEGAPARLEKIKKAVTKIAQNKKVVIVDGVGYPAVGSVAGVSNGEVAAYLGVPVLLVAKPGLGNAIDSVNLNLAFFEKYHVPVLGAVWNKIPPTVTYHTYEDCKKYVNKYFQDKMPSFGRYGHIPLYEDKKEEGARVSSLAGEAVACYLRPAKKDLVMTEDEKAFSTKMVDWVRQYMDVPQLMKDLDALYERKAAAAAAPAPAAERKAASDAAADGGKAAAGSNGDAASSNGDADSGDDGADSAQSKRKGKSKAKSKAKAKSSAKGKGAKRKREDDADKGEAAAASGPSDADGSGAAAEPRAKRSRVKKEDA